MSADILKLLQTIWDLTHQLHQNLAQDLDPEHINSLLDQRQNCLDQLAQLGVSKESLSPEIAKLLKEIQTLGTELLSQLSAQQIHLREDSSDLTTTHHAMKAYLPQESSEAYYIEEES